MKRRIYLASSWRNAQQPAAVAALRDAGHEVYDFRNPPGATGFSWSEIDPNWEGWTCAGFTKGLLTPRATDGFANDLSGMVWADTCVLLLPCGRSAHAEAGWMAGVGKNVFVIFPDGQEPELMYRLFQGIFPSIEALIADLKQRIPTHIYPASDPWGPITPIS